MVFEQIIVFRNDLRRNQFSANTYCFELVIKYETLELKEKMDASTHNIVTNYHSGAYCDIALTAFGFPLDHLYL